MTHQNLNQLREYRQSYKTRRLTDCAFAELQSISEKDSDRRLAIDASGVSNTALCTSPKVSPCIAEVAVRR